MRDKINARKNKMSAALIKDPKFVGRSANRMARDVLTAEFRGPGDTIPSAAYRLQTKRGLDANITLQGWNRNLEGKGMDARRWLPLFIAWVETSYKSERAKHDNDTALTRLADLVAGEAAENGGEQ